MSEIGTDVKFLLLSTEEKTISTSKKLQFLILFFLIGLINNLG
jgi:hypothetical protein